VRLSLAISPTNVRNIIGSAAAGWTPAELGADLALWLDADDASTITLNGSTVSQWNDKSGNDNHVSQGSASAQPEFAATGLNSKPTLRFNSPTQGRHLLSSVNFPSMTGGVSAIVVAQVDTVDNWNGYVGVGALVANTSNFEFYRQVGGNSGNLVISANRDQPGGNLNFRFRNNVDTPPAQGAPHIATAVISGATGLAGFMSVNGGGNLPLGGGTEHPTGTFIPQGTGIIRVGVGYFSGDTAASVMRGRISEIVMSASPWSNADRQKLEGYLAWKWGLTFELPADHPYKWYGSLFGFANQDGFDADAKAYITAVETSDGQDLEPGVRSAINDFVVGCKADGIWDAIKSSCIMAGARTLSGALVPLKGTGPTNFNFVTGDYDRKTGLVGDGSTKYLDSNRNNNADPQNNAHLSCYISTVASATGAHIGCAQAAGGLSWIARNANVGLILQTRGIDNSIPTVNSHLTTGFKGATRSDSTQMTRRFDGATATVDINSTATNANNYFVFASNTGISAVIFANGRLAFYSIGESIDLAQLDARVTTLINAYGAI
jgi:hypothetical protein